MKVIASTTPAAGRVFERLCKIIDAPGQMLEIRELGPELAGRVIREWLAAKSRTLSPRQQLLVSRVLEKSSLPIFVRLVFATVARWKSYSRAQVRFVIHFP